MEGVVEGEGEIEGSGIGVFVGIGVGLGDGVGVGVGGLVGIGTGVVERTSSCILALRNFHCFLPGVVFLSLAHLLRY